MSYTNSAADYQALSKTQRHKTGTKRHKNLSERPASVISKIGSNADAATPLLRDRNRSGSAAHCLGLIAGQARIFTKVMRKRAVVGSSAGTLKV
jgi:hypothetical protein